MISHKPTDHSFWNNTKGNQMKEVVRKINPRNQVTLPKKMLNMLRAQPGDYVKVRANEKARVVEVINVKIIDLS